MDKIAVPCNKLDISAWLILLKIQLSHRDTKALGIDYVLSKTIKKCANHDQRERRHELWYGLLPSGTSFGIMNEMFDNLRMHEKTFNVDYFTGYLRLASVYPYQND